MTYRQNCIYFKKHIFNLIKEGKKTSTLRTYSNISKGKTVNLVCGKEEFNAIIVDKIKVYWEDIGNEIIELEGLENKDQLKQILKECYPNKEIKKLWLIIFKII